MCAKRRTSNKSNVLLSYSKQEKVSPWKTCTSLTIILLTMKLNNIRSWNQPRYVLTDDIVKEYFSELHEYLPDFEICEKPKEIVPALKGQRLQLDSLPPLLMCLIKRYKQDIKKAPEWKFALVWNSLLWEKMTPYPSLFTCFPLTCLFCYSVLISTK